MMRCSLPVRPRVRPRGAQKDSQRLDEGLQLRAALGHDTGNVGEGVAAAGPDLDLGGDQLTDQVLGERSSGCRGLHLLEAVDEIERFRVEQGELLLDGRREVGRLLELLARERDLLVR